MPKKKYQVGIQEAVWRAIKDAKNTYDLPYINKKQIIKDVAERQKIKLKDPNAQVGQAINKLQKGTKFRRPKIKVFRDKKGRKKGWIPTEETGRYDAFHLPRRI